MDTTAMLELLAKPAHILQTILDDDPDALLVRDANQRTLLHWAAVKGARDHVRLLLDRLQRLDDAPQAAAAAAIDAADDTGTTPLICATLKGDAVICAQLVAAGADVNARTEQGHSPVQYACSKGWLDCYEVLVGAEADIAAVDRRGDSVLHRLVALGRDELLRRVLELAKTRAPRLVDVQNAEGDTALHIACEESETACALLLVEYGANVRLENRLKRSPLDGPPSALRRSLAEKAQSREARAAAEAKTAM